MNRKINRGIIVIPVLIIALLVSMQGPVLATATTTAVEGRADLSDGFIEPGKIWFDNGGNMHFQNVVGKGNLTLHGDGIDIDGKQILELNGTLDETSTGPFGGVYTVSTDIEGEEVVIWQGHYHGRITNAIFSGKITAQGRGPFEGMQLKLDIQEDAATPGNPNPETFDVWGRILDPHGQ